MPQTGAAAVLMASPLAATAASSQSMLTIEKVDATVKVLNTKTRPKRLQLLGSDGHTYNFLLKVCHGAMLLLVMSCDGNAVGNVLPSLRAL